MNSTTLCLATPRRPRRRLRRLCVAFGVTALAGAGLASGPTSAESPARIGGDPHSQTVVRLATRALDAKRSYDQSKTAADRAAYQKALKAAAEATAAEFGVARMRMASAWARTDNAHQTALLTALTQLGVEYQSATSEPGVGFDCSGLMFYAWGQAGFTLARQSGSQISDADVRDMQTAKAGDLAQYPGHVMMYLGIPQTFVHSSNPENDVELWMTSPDRAAGLNYGDPSK